MSENIEVDIVAAFTNRLVANVLYEKNLKENYVRILSDALFRIDIEIKKESYE